VIVVQSQCDRFEGVAAHLHAWREAENTRALRLEYRFFHPAVIRRQALLF
jgi:hypothetical protein